MVKTYLEVTKPTRKVVAAVIKPKTPKSVKDATAYAQKLESPEQKEKDAAGDKKDTKASVFDDKIVAKKKALKKEAKEKKTMDKAKAALNGGVKPPDSKPSDAAATKARAMANAKKASVK